jgi:hypothetical protein
VFLLRLLTRLGVVEGPGGRPASGVKFVAERIGWIAVGRLGWSPTTVKGSLCWLFIKFALLVHPFRPPSLRPYAHHQHHHYRPTQKLPLHTIHVHTYLYILLNMHLFIMHMYILTHTHTHTLTHASTLINAFGKHVIHVKAIWAICL